MATPTGEVTTILTYRDIKHTLVMDEQTKIAIEDWERMREIAGQIMNEQVIMIRGNFGESPLSRLAFGWCMPSREGLHTGIISREEAEGLWLDNPTPVEEDNVFAPREVEVVT